jgi:hypothetical protein
MVPKEWLKQGSILQKTLSVENFLGKFSSSNFGPISTQNDIYEWAIHNQRFKVF